MMSFESGFENGEPFKYTPYLSANIVWPNACLGCGISDYMGLTTYDLDIGPSWKKNYPHSRLIGGGRVYLCNPCREFAISEQRTIIQSRLLGMILSIFLISKW